MMDDLEQQLRRALAREDAPPWLEAKVMAAAATPKRRVWWPRWAYAVVCAVMLLALGGWQYERAARERAEAELATAKLELALKVTSEKLQSIQRKVKAAAERSKGTI